MSTEAALSFEVETTRILQILAKEIYDSPYAMLRENIQNAYDATLMRCTERGEALEGKTITVVLQPTRVAITDEGIGMTAEVLADNYWKAGSSGKRGELAQRAGVVGTFGIGAMANFGVCTRLRVETRVGGASETLVSEAVRENLKIGQKCISLESVSDMRPVGTSVYADLDPAMAFNPAAALEYLRPFVQHLPVRVVVNGEVVSQRPFSDSLQRFMSGVGAAIGTHTVTSGALNATATTYLNANGAAVVQVSSFVIGGRPVAGEALLVQQAGPLMGYRNSFGLAAIPASSYYQFGGAVNLGVLHPTAGREALSRESVALVQGLLNAVQIAASMAIASTEAADRNASFHQFVQSQGRYDLAYGIGVEVKPGDVSVPMGEIRTRYAGAEVKYYTGRDPGMIATFSSGHSVLLHVSQNNPRRSIQLAYLRDTLHVPEVPDKVTLGHVYTGSELTLAEVALQIRVNSTLLEDYLLSGAEVSFADISHNVAVLVPPEAPLRIFIARGSPILTPVLQCYRTAHEVFTGFVKDFVRVHLYDHIKNRVPTATRDGSDALVKMLQRSRELYRYEESEQGEMDPLIAEYLAGKVSLTDVLHAAVATSRQYSHRVTSNQVGSVEREIPGITEGPAPTVDAGQPTFGPVPPILRTDLSSTMKVLLASQPVPQLNGFTTFLGLSDRLYNRHSTFFFPPHTVKIIWGAHRVIYIFGYADEGATLYYDIELKSPLDQARTGGGMFPTTTLITKDRIYVPVPREIEDVFRVTEGAKEFYVRFDVV